MGLDRSKAPLNYHKYDALPAPEVPERKKILTTIFYSMYYVFLIKTLEMLILGQTSVISKIRLLREVPLALVAKINPLIKLVTLLFGRNWTKFFKSKRIMMKEGLSSVWPPRL